MTTLKERLAIAEAALEDVVNPLAKLHRDAVSQGCRLSGAAYQFANDLYFVQSIARDALARLTLEGGSDHAE